MLTKSYTDFDKVFSVKTSLSSTFLLHSHFVSSIKQGKQRNGYERPGLRTEEMTPVCFKFKAEILLNYGKEQRVRASFNSNSQHPEPRTSWRSKGNSFLLKT